MQTMTAGATAFADASTSLNYCEFTFTDGLNPHSQAPPGDGTRGPGKGKRLGSLNFLKSS